jgi:L-cysteine S-thiosulfotransferase
MSTSLYKSVSAGIFLCSFGVVLVSAATAQDVGQPAAAPTAASSPGAEGRAIALNRTKGNCAVCHAIPDVEFHGDIAPPLVAMKQRFPDREKLHAQVFDATQLNPSSIMPPFGRHQILTPDELDKVVDWLMTL